MASKLSMDELTKQDLRSCRRAIVWAGSQWIAGSDESLADVGRLLLKLEAAEATAPDAPEAAGPREPEAP